MPMNYNHPARVAERIATLDLVSNGRVEFGTGESASLADRYEVTEYLTEVMLSPGTEAVGRSLRELELGEKDVTILGVIRGDS